MLVVPAANLASSRLEKAEFPALGQNCLSPTRLRRAEKGEVPLSPPCAWKVVTGPQAREIPFYKDTKCCVENFSPDIVEALGLCWFGERSLSVGRDLGNKPQHNKTNKNTKEKTVLLLCDFRVAEHSQIMGAGDGKKCSQRGLRSLQWNQVHGDQG